MTWNFQKPGFYTDRMRRSSREIMIALALTLAALAFLVAALLGGAVTGPSKVGPVAADDMAIK
jgi:hypothetical protein